MSLAQYERIYDEQTTKNWVQDSLNRFHTTTKQLSLCCLPTIFWFFLLVSRVCLFSCVFFWLVNVYCVFSNDGFSFDDRERKYAKNTHSNAIQNHFGNCQFEWIEAFVGVISSALYVEFFFRAYFLNRCTQVYLWMWCFFLVGFLCSTSDKCTILWTIDVFWLHFPVLVFERVRIHLAHKHIYWISFFLCCYDTLTDTKLFGMHTKWNFVWHFS